jgi:ferredoxin-NADP reductase
MFITISNKNRELKKHFTISSSPTEKKFIEFTKKLTGSEFSNALEDLSIGAKAKIDAPYGKFTLDKEHNKIAMLSGGIGITPLRSICKYVTDKKLKKSIILLYGNNTAQDIAFKEEFEILQKQNKNLKIIHVLNKPPPEWKGYTGFIDSNTIKKEITDYKKRLFYTCGPPGMINAMKKILQELNLPKSQIRIENFTGY